MLILRHFCTRIKKQHNMKNLLSILFAIALFASCQKEPCQFGTIEIQNAGDVPATVYSIPSRPVLLPGETINQEVEICSGFDSSGYECGDAVQTVVTFQFENGEMKSTAELVSRCQTVTVQIFN